MSRRGGLDWEAARRDKRQREAGQRERATPVYVRQAERSDPAWYLRFMRYPAACQACGDEIVKGERCWMRRVDAWQFRHEACRE